MMPKFVRTAADFATTVRLGTTPESLVLDFKRSVGITKEAPSNERRKAQKETCRDIAQFANTLGGCVLIGVDEAIGDSGVRVAKSVQPIAEADELRQWIEQAIVNFLVPSTFSHDIAPVSVPGEGMIVAVNVPASVHMISLWDRESHAVEYVRRTSHGKEWMNPDEAERHLMNGSRASRLQLLALVDRAPKRQDVVVAGGLWNWSSQAPTSPPVRWMPRSTPKLVVADEWFSILVPIQEGSRQSLHLPYSVLTDSWLGGDGTINLILSVRLVIEDGKLTVDPYG